MAAPAAPPKPEFDDCDETTIKCKWTPDPSCSYKLQYREIVDEWGSEGAMEILVAQGEGSAGTDGIADLNPTSTYAIRLIAVKVRVLLSVAPTPALSCPACVSPWSCLCHRMVWRARRAKSLL